MATIMTGTVALRADKATVWAKLNDVALLQACIPGCHMVDQKSETRFGVIVKVHLGPVGVAFRGHVTLSDLDPPHFYRLAGEGEGGIAGMASGAASIMLSDMPNGCALHYRVEAGLQGWIAQFAGPLVDGIARHLADRFFTRFAALMTLDRVAQGERPRAGQACPKPGSRPAAASTSSIS